MRNLLRRCLSRLSIALFFSSLTLALWLGQGLPFPRSSSVQAATPAQLVQDGVALYQAGDYQSAVDRWQAALQAYSSGAGLSDRALVHENLAHAYRQLGQSSEAIDAWVAAADIYRQLGNASQVGRMLTEQAQVHLSLGQHRRAIALLCLPKDETSIDYCEPNSALPIAITASDILGQVAALGSLGEAYRLQGYYQGAKDFLNQGLVMAREAKYVQFEVPMLNSLGSIASRQAQIDFRRADGAAQVGLTDIAADFSQTAKDYETTAQQLFEDALATAQQQASSMGEFQTRLNLLPIHRRQNNLGAIAATRQHLGVLIEQLPASRDVVYGAIALGRSYQPVSTAFRCVIPGSEEQARVC